MARFGDSKTTGQKMAEGPAGSPRDLFAALQARLDQVPQSRSRVAVLSFAVPGEPRWCEYGFRGGSLRVTYWVGAERLLTR